MLKVNCGNPDTSGICHLCQSQLLEGLGDSSIHFWVSSDSKAVQRGEPLAVCKNCGGVQKHQSPSWMESVQRIYANYSIYENSAGSEQLVFESAKGGGASRSLCLLDRLRKTFDLPSCGRFLDIGCGNGATLRAFSQLWPDWMLYGSELSSRHKAQVESIPGVEKLYTEPLEKIEGQFDLVSLIHVLEHIPDPVGYLRGLRSKISRGGLLLIEVPNFSANPFDLVIADHCTHFSSDSIRAVVEAAGLEVKSVSKDWIPKEITLIAAAGQAHGRGKLSVNAAESQGGTFNVNRQLNWLVEVISEARAISVRCREKGEGFGLFGTTIAATWLFAELEEAVDFFVDENDACAGKTYLGRPVYLPRDIPSKSEVYVCLPQPVSANVVGRLGHEFQDAAFIETPRL